jgi:hypothetical protein
VIYAAVLIPLLTGGIEPIHAQIYEWLDDANGRHFANSLDRVPPETRGDAKLVVTRAETQAGSDTPSPNTGGTAEVDENQVTEDLEAFESGWDEGFEAGWAEGFRAASEELASRPTEPVVVFLDDRPPVAVNLPRYDPTGAYYRSPYAMTVTIPFDNGASRGLTRRQVVQDVRGIERGW